jgi:hypothetical protein
MNRIAGLLVLALLLPQIPAQAAPKAGSSCKSVGESTKSNGKTLLCVKSGQKKLWKVQAAVPLKPSASPTPTISSSASPSPAPTPPAKPTSFDDLVEKSQGIALQVWNVTRKPILSGKVISTPRDVYIGPNTMVTNPQYQADFATASKLWSGYNQPKQYIAIYNNFTDIDWAKSLGAAQTGKSVDFEINMNCSAERCNGANANIGTPNMINFGINPNNSQAYFLNGGIEAHEFTHLVQFSQFDDNRSALYNEYFRAPCWFREGQAHFGGLVSAATTFMEYQNNRKDWLRTGASGLLTDFEKTTILNFLNNSCQDKNGHVYDAGFFAVEALSAVAGATSSMDLLKEMAAGKSFDVAFTSTYGKSQSELLPIVAEAVSRQFKKQKGIS